MTKHIDIEKKWIATVRTLLVVDAGTVGIFLYLLANRIKGDPDFPSYKELLIASLGFIISNVVIYYFMKSIKDVVKSVTRRD